MFFGGDPFEHFAHGHGGGGGGRRATGGNVDTTKLYETLGVSNVRRFVVIVFFSFFLTFFSAVPSSISMESSL